MNRLPAAWNRVSVGLIGLLLICLGLAGIFAQTGVEPVAGWIARIDPDKISRGADAGWWTWVLVGVALLAVIWAVRLLATMVRPQAAADLVLDGSAEGGRMTIAPGLIATAVADELSGSTLLDDVAVKAIDDRGSTILRISVTAPAHRSYDEIEGLLADTVEQVRTAFDGSGLHVQAMVELASPNAGRL
ncbi:hypothetical protein [Gordonia caeni]|uniref:Alkaline shock response membrane anchor protein AmaP n=1 Tax=Gordonia caeni TaxID=1007097 RepID=A0ABP7NI51_9ACTN